MNFKKTQIKQTIEKIMLVAQKNNGHIPIASIMDASNFFAYLEGYPSWSSYVQENMKSNTKIKDTDDSRMLDGKSWEIPKDIKIYLNSSYLDEVINRLKIKDKNKGLVDIQEVKDLDKKITLGFKFNKVTKSKDIFFLNKENTLMIGSPEIKDSIIVQMKDNKSAFIKTSNERENAYLLNPIEEIFKTKLIDAILGDEVKKSLFDAVWLSIIHEFSNDFDKEIDIDLLLNSIDLKFIIAYFVKISDSHINKKIIKSYLDNIGVKIDNEEFVEIKGDSISIHNQEIQKIKKLLRHIKLGYVEGVFSDTKEGISYCLRNKKSISLFISDKESDYGCMIYSKVLEFNFQNYDNSTKNFKKENFGIWFINNNKNILKGNLDYKNIFSLRMFDSIVSINNVFEEQIIFGKLSAFSLIEKDFMLYFYLNTKNMEDNIFNEAGKELLNLSDKDFYLWQKEDSSFNLIKITT
jgi:hypothetical protein